MNHWMVASPSRDELIFRRALASTNVQAILKVAGVFHGMGRTRAAALLQDHARSIENVGFGGPGGTVSVGDVQVKLNALGAQPPLATDGVAGPKTTAAVVAFQSANNLVPDGKVGPLTLAALGFTGMQAMIPGLPTGSGGAVPSASVPAGVNASVVAIHGIEKLTPADLKALADAANWIGINVDWLATAMSFESGLNPAAVNASSGATGLIQFMPSTAQNLGTTTAALKQMTFIQQLEYVKAYFAPKRGQLHSLEDVYLAIFYPAEIGKSPTDVIASAGNPVYDQNAVFDRTGKGYITREDVTATITSLLNQAVAMGQRIAIPGAAVAAGIGGVLLVIGGALVWVFRKKLFGV